MGLFGLVVKPHSPKLDAAILDLVHWVLRIHNIWLLLYNLADALGRGRTLRQHDKNHRQHHQRLQDAHDVGEQAGQLTRGQRAADNELGTPPRQGDDAAVDHDVHHGVVQRHQAFSAYI